MRTTPKILHRGTSTVDPKDPSIDTRAAEERAERLRFSLPLLLLAVTSLVAAYVLLHDSFAPHATHVPLWVLAFSVGVIASVGGSTALFVGDFSGDDWIAEARASPDYVVVDEREWSSMKAELRAARGGARGGLGLAPAFEIPEWSEPAERAGVAGGDPAPATQGPPAPMSVTHGIDSLATEVDRLVADLESAAAQHSAPPNPSRVASSPPPAAKPVTPELSPIPPPTRPSTVAGSGPEPGVGRPSRPARGEAPARRSASAPPRPPVSPAPVRRDDAVSEEYRVLLAELEARAAKGTTASRLPPPRPVPGPPDARCVGCDARMGANDRTYACRSCRSPMCVSCHDRSAKEGYRDLCAVCSILEESQPRDGPERR
jgi:hypothetical protein